MECGKHNRMEWMKCNGGWIKIKNLPLSLWNKENFVAIGEKCGEFISILLETINLLNCFEASIEVKRNQCGFIPASMILLFTILFSTM